MLDLHKEWIIAIFTIVIITLYYFSESIVRGIYEDIRNTIQYAKNDKEAMIRDGDLGLLYDEMRMLKQRTLAYEKTIDSEKDKLRETIEDICHQLKTPLTSISIYNELLLEQTRDNQYLIDTQQQIEKMNYLVQSLLKLAKLQGHQVEFQLELSSIDKVFELSIQSLSSLIQKNHKVIDVQKCEVECYYDEGWLEEAISNIIKNALEKDCKNIKIWFEDYKQFVKIFIYNDGLEIKEKDLPHIFERFYHTDKQHGVGIGLALSKEIIMRHHGDIIVYNQNGVIFEITLPKFQVNEKYQLS